MNKDRTKICEIISEMLDNPDKSGIYPTTVCYDKLESYMEDIRAEKQESVLLRKAYNLIKSYEKLTTAYRSNKSIDSGTYAILQKKNKIMKEIERELIVLISFQNYQNYRKRCLPIVKGNVKSR